LEVQQALQEQISSVCSPFELVKVEGCGSDANLYAINSITSMNPQQCAIAAGSYISGDHGPLQSLSSCVEYEDKSLTMIATPTECTGAAQNITLPFPYYIPGGCINQIELHKLEAICIREIFLRILVSKASGRPMIAIFLELMLAGNGAILSDKFLNALGILADIYELKFVVDEIMTAGRSKSMLFTLRTPHMFLKNVGYVTMGKWPGVGMVLEQPSVIKDAYVTGVYRGTSTFIDLTLTYRKMRSVSRKLSYSEERRLQFLAKHRLHPDECWGHGTIIFTPINKLISNHGFHCRYLPLLENIPFKPFQYVCDGTVTKNTIGLEINHRVQQWILHSRSHNDSIDRDILLLLSSQTNFHQKTASEYRSILEKILNKNYTIHQIVLCFHNLKDKGLVTLETITINNYYEDVIIHPVGLDIKYNPIKMGYIGIEC
jgi:hypothetical protein